MSQNRILDRNSYSKKTLDTFEVIGSYFVDIYYNHLYLEAKKLKNERSVNNITDGYKHGLNAYLQGIDNPKLYKKTLIDLHKFFIASGFSSISFSEYLERMTQEFIPQDYYESVSNPQKISILKLVLCQSNKIFIEKIVRNYMKMIIDEHMEADNVRVLQDEFIDILLLQREGMYDRFISSKTKNNGISPNIRLIEKMQNEIKSLYKEKYDLKKLNVSLKKIIINKDEELKKLIKENDILRNNVIEVENELKGLKNDTSERKNNLIDINNVLSENGSIFESKENNLENQTPEPNNEINPTGIFNGVNEEMGENNDNDENNKESDKLDNMLKLDDFIGKDWDL